MVRAGDWRAHGRLPEPLVARVEHFPGVMVHGDLEALPPVLAQRKGAAEDAGALRLHWLLLPAIEGPHEGIPPLRDLVVFELAAALRPEEDLLALWILLRNGAAVLLRDLSPTKRMDVRAGNAPVRDAREGAGEPVLQHLGTEVRGALAGLNVHVRVEDPQVQAGVHGAPVCPAADLDDRGEAVGLDLVAPVGLARQQPDRARLVKAGHALWPVGLRSC
mmetsp:Transcript_29925/g.85882  ORF Transcript_29925/g.85882 Transcript_29925/m.85882 type:complete len:219 (+) Transcript_29925:1154-1810(+)